MSLGPSWNDQHRYTISLKRPHLTRRSACRLGCHQTPWHQGAIHGCKGSNQENAQVGLNSHAGHDIIVKHSGAAFRPRFGPV